MMEQPQGLQIPELQIQQQPFQFKIEGLCNLTNWESYNLWQKHSFVYEKQKNDITDLPLSQQEILGLIYLRKMRERVMRYKFALLGSWEAPWRQGKSLSAVTMLCLLDETFQKDMEARIVQSPQEYIQIAMDLEANKIEGGGILCDEMGAMAGGSSLDWQTELGKIISKSTQLLGYIHPIIFTTAPASTMVQSQVRILNNILFRVKRYNNLETTITAYHLEYQSMFKKQFYRKPEIEIGNEKIQIRRFILPMPPPEIVDRYREIERARKTPQLQDFSNDALKADLKKKKDMVDPASLVSSVVDKYKLFEARISTQDNIRLDPTLLEFSLKLTGRQSKILKSLAERKLNEKQKEAKQVMESKEGEKIKVQLQELKKKNPADFSDRM